MSLERGICECCGGSQYKCPECGSNSVTGLEDLGKADLDSYAMGGPGGEYEYKNVCWECDWNEVVYVDIAFGREETDGED